MQSEPFEDVATYRGDIIVGLKFIPQEGAGTSNSHGAILRKLSLRSSFLNNSNSPNTGSNSNNTNSTKGSLHVMVKGSVDGINCLFILFIKLFSSLYVKIMKTEAKHLSPVKANGHVDSFCKRFVYIFISIIHRLQFNYFFDMFTLTVISCPKKHAQQSRKLMLLNVQKILDGKRIKFHNLHNDDD